MSYQNILLVIQGLPRQRETVDRFSTIIGAPFKSGARCPSVIIDAFDEFWKSSYVDVNEPVGGWPAPIKAALHASRQAGESSSTSQDHKDLDPVSSDQSSTRKIVDEPFREISSSGEIELGKAAGLAVVEYPVRSDPRSPITKSPSTPRKERRVHVSTPPRRQRTSSSPKTLRPFGPEPRSPLTDLRKRNAPPASFITSPTPKGSDKENVSPKPLPDIFASVLGKRKLGPTVEESTSSMKRKITSSKSLKTARDYGNATVIANEGLTETAGDGVGNTPSKKRKSEVFAGVMVPTVKEVMLRRRHSAPLREEADSQQFGLSDLSVTTLRKSRSAARMNVVDHRNKDDLEASPRKKIRTMRSSEPVPPMFDFPVAGSGNAVCLHLRDEFEANSTNFCGRRFNRAGGFLRDCGSIVLGR